MLRPLLRALFPGLLLLVACGKKPAEAGGKGEKGKKGQAPQKVVVDVIVAQNRPVNNIIEATGTVLASESVELHAEISGRITYLNVPEGRTVSKGTVIARIFDADLRAQLQKSKAQLDLAEKTEARLKKLIAIGGINQADYDAAVNNVASLKSDIGYTEAQIEKTYIKAPFSGLVGLRQVSPGAFVSPTNIIATIQQVSTVKIDFTLPEEFSAAIHIGGQVNVILDQASGVKKKALVIATEPQVNQATRNIKVRAVLLDGTANPGAFVKVEINTSAGKEAIMVPTSAIIPEDITNQLILVKGGRASFVKVKTGIREASNVEITSGVKLGDTVVVTGVLFARPKSEVRVRSVKKLEDLAVKNQLPQ